MKFLAPLIEVLLFCIGRPLLPKRFERRISAESCAAVNLTLNLQKADFLDSARNSTAVFAIKVCKSRHVHDKEPTATLETRIPDRSKSLL
jgi:hypothetical protein